MAEGIFEKLSGYKAMSAGVDPADKPDKNVINALKEASVSGLDKDFSLLRIFLCFISPICVLDFLVL